MNINIFLVLLAIFIMAGSVVIENRDAGSDLVGNSDKEESCALFDAEGKEFVFRELSPSLQEFGYPTWIKSPDLSNLSIEVLSYEAYVGKHARLKEDVVSVNSSDWFVAITETCEIIYNAKIYLDEKSGEDLDPVKTLESYTWVYFLDTQEKAKTLLGNEVWAKIPNEREASHLLFTSNPEIRYSRSNLQKLHVIGIDTYLYDHTFTMAPFSLVVKTETGEEALLPYSSKEFYETYPISVN